MPDLLFLFVIRIFRCLFYDEIYELCGTEFHSCTLGRHGKSGKQCGSGVVTAGSIALVEGGNVILISSVVLVLLRLSALRCLRRRGGRERKRQKMYRRLT